MQHITATELAAWLKDKARSKPLLLDVREPWEYQTCHIEGSQPMPMNTVPDGYDTLDMDAPVVCICHHGARSMKVAHFLEHHGFTNAINLTGGVDAWARQVDSTMPTY